MTPINLSRVWNHRPPMHWQLSSCTTEPEVHPMLQRKMFLFRPNAPSVSCLTLPSRVYPRVRAFASHHSTSNTGHRGAAHPDIRSLFNADAYPLHDLEGAEGRDLLLKCRHSLETAHFCMLPGFLPSHVCRALQSEALSSVQKCFYSLEEHNAYLVDDDPALPVLQHKLQSSKKLLAADQIPADSPLQRLFAWTPLLRFVGSVLGVAPLYPAADPLGSVYYNYFYEGDQLGWHFDNTPFFVNLIVQSPWEGGVFEFIPNLRSDDCQNYDQVQACLRGDAGAPTATQIPLQTGDLIVFRGKYNLHRVTPVIGAEPRINAILTYSPDPNMTLNEYTRKKFFGR